jgi:uncharacterized protein (UPF0548 family)
MPTRKRSSRAVPQATVAIASVLLLGITMIAGRGHMGTLRGSAQGDAASVTITHAAARTVTLRETSHHAPGLVELSARDGQASARVPEDWTLREVRGASLSEVPGDPPAHGERRWTLATGAVLSFTTPRSTALRIRNDAVTPLLVRYVLVDLETERVREDSVLMGREEEREIWR